MELAWLEDFLTLAQQRNFSRAAEARHISQPAFSRRVRMLEDWIGAPLFDRDTHRVELTAAGAEFFPIAQEIVRRLAFARTASRPHCWRKGDPRPTYCMLTSYRGLRRDNRATLARLRQFASMCRMTNASMQPARNRP